MEDEIIRPQDVEQVLFLGQNTIKLAEFRLKYPQTKEYSNIIFGDPHFFGLMKTERMATSIDNTRILRQQVTIRGRRTLVVLADLNAIDKNKSFLDLLTYELNRDINEFKIKNKYLTSENMLFNQFIEEKHLESSWEEWLLNKLELLRIAAIKVAGKPPEVTPVAVEVGEKKEK